MKKIIFILFLGILLFNSNLYLECKEVKKDNKDLIKDETLLGAVKKDSVVNPKKVAIVGRIFFDPEVKQDIKINSMGVVNVAYILFKKDEKGTLNNFLESDDFLTSHFNDYFCGWFKKQDLFLRTVTMDMEQTFSDKHSQYYRTLSKLKIPNDAKLLYIGDLYFKTENNKTVMTVVDNFEEAKKIYDGFIKTKDGTPVNLEKSLVEGDENVKIEDLYVHTSTTFRNF
jgi:hypothetical protein